MTSISVDKNSQIVYFFWKHIIFIKFEKDPYFRPADKNNKFLLYLGKLVNINFYSSIPRLLGSVYIKCLIFSKYKGINQNQQKMLH